MAVFLVSGAVLGLSMLAMAVGVLVGRPALRNGCRCAGDGDGAEGACAACPRARPDRATRDDGPCAAAAGADVGGER